MQGVFLFFGFWGVGCDSGQCWCGPVSVRAGAVFGPVSVQCRCGLVQCSVGPVQCGAGQCGVGVGWCSFRAGVSAVFILNGMIFSFLDEKRVFKGVV